MKKKLFSTKPFCAPWRLIVLLMAVSSSYCEDPEQELDKAQSTLLAEYGKGKEIARANVVGIDYRPTCIEKSLVAEKILTEAESKKIFDASCKLDKKYLRTKIYNDPFRAKLSELLGKIKQKDPAKNSKTVENFTNLLEKNEEELTATEGDVVDLALQAIMDSRIV